MPVTNFNKVLIVAILLSFIFILPGQKKPENSVSYRHFFGQSYEVRDSVLQLYVNYADSTKDSIFISVDSSQYFPPKLFRHHPQDNFYMGLFPCHRRNRHTGNAELLYFNAPENRKQTYYFCEEDSSWFLYKIVVEQYPVLEPLDIKIE